MAKIGLFFGSFNPVHIGHLMIANYFYAETDLDAVWLVVTPQSPWKEKKSLIADKHRLNMINLATKGCNWIQASLFEKDLPQPNYTFQSLEYLRNEHPDNEFVLIIGGDNYERFYEWKNANEIVTHHKVWAFPRHTAGKPTEVKNIRLFQAPKIEISAEKIRAALRQHKDMKYFLPQGVYEYIKQHQLL